MGFMKRIRKSVRESHQRAQRAEAIRQRRVAEKHSPAGRSARSPRAVVVRVAYLEPHEPVPTRVAERKTGGYAYFWRLPMAPNVGDEVLAPVGDLQTSRGVIIGYGRAGYSGPLLSIDRLPPGH